MTRPLFRQQAVDYRYRSRTEGRVAVWRDRAASRLFVAMLVLLALSGAAAFILRVEEVATGTVYVAQGSSDATVLLPVGAAARLREGQQVRLDLGGEVTTRVTRVEDPRTEGGTTYAVVRVDVRPGGAATGRATVVLARHPLAAALVPSLGD